jgi:EpsI family protein
VITAMAVSFLIPVPKYTSLNILKEINIPTEFPGWRSFDVSKQLNLKDDRYNFISDVFARIYQNRKGQQLLFLVLDAGNFHNPKVCYTSSGFDVKELDSVELSSTEGPFNSSALLMQREKGGLFMFYWLCIDKKIVGWTGQKMLELWSSLSNKKKAGIMVRIEIPLGEITDKNIVQDNSIALGRDFIQALDKSLTLDQKEYLFGQ